MPHPSDWTEDFLHSDSTTPTCFKATLYLSICRFKSRPFDTRHFSDRHEIFPNKEKQHSLHCRGVPQRSLSIICSVPSPLHPFSTDPTSAPLHAVSNARYCFNNGRTFTLWPATESISLSPLHAPPIIAICQSSSSLSLPQSHLSVQLQCFITSHTCWSISLWIGLISLINDSTSW